MGLKIPPDCSNCNCTYFSQIYPHTVVFVPFDTQHTKCVVGVPHNVAPVGMYVYTMCLRKQTNKQTNKQTKTKQKQKQQKQNKTKQNGP